MLPSPAEIGRLMGEQPEVHWAVMNADETAYIMDFDRCDCTNPQREAEEWFERHQRNHPENVALNGYHVVRRENWPDYMGEHGDCAAVSRFINLAFRQLVATNAQDKLQAVVERVRQGESMQLALANTVLPESGS